jgi:hypothetical protein
MKKFILLIIVSAFLGACSAGASIDLYGQNSTSTHTYV